MSLRATLFACAAAVTGVTGCARTPLVPPPTVTTAAVQAPNTTGDAALLTATARVVSVDHANRTVRLRGPKGRTFTVGVGPEVQKFDQVRRGDTVTVQYYESVAFTLGKPGTATPRRCCLDQRRDRAAWRAARGSGRPANHRNRTGDRDRHECPHPDTRRSEGRQRPNDPGDRPAAPAGHAGREGGGHNHRHHHPGGRRLGGAPHLRRKEISLLSSDS